MGITLAGDVQTAAEATALDRLYTSVAVVLRGEPLDHAFTVIASHLAGLCVANGIGRDRAIDAFKEAHAAYQRKANQGAWKPR